MDYKPTNYTATEGAEWISSEGIDLSSVPFAAVMFSDGTVWDEIMQNWRGDLARDSFVPDKPPMAVIKHAGGRPTDYRPEYCDLVILWGSKGKSAAWVAGELGCTAQTLTNWQTANPEFLASMEIANRKSQQWWEDAGQYGMAGKTIDGSIWSRSMGARFPNDWRENSKTETTINKGDGWSDLFALIGNQTKSI